MAKVSVILPNYNCAAYLSKAIKSIIDQTYEDFEVLICDDGSTDNSLSIAYDWADRDSRVKVYKNEQNKGNVYTYNRLFFLASGDYILIQDADDWSHPERIEKQLKVIDTYGVDICLTNFTEYKLDGTIGSKPLETYSGYVDVNDEAKWGAPATMLFKREILHTIPGFHTYFERLTVMDRYFLLEVLSNYKGYFLDEYLYYVLARPQSDHRGIDLNDKNALRKLAIQGVFKELKRQRIATGSDWLKEGKLDSLETYEQQLISNKLYMAEAFRSMACKQIECNGFHSAAELLKAAIKRAPMYKKNYRTVLYYLRTIWHNRTGFGSSLSAM